MSEPTVYCTHRKGEACNSVCMLKHAKRLLRQRMHPRKTPTGTKPQRML